MGFRPVDLQISIPRSGEVNKVQNNQGSQFNQEFAQQQQLEATKQKQKQVNESNKSENNSIGKNNEGKNKSGQNAKEQEKKTNKEKEQKNQEKNHKLFDPGKGRYIDINI